MDIHQLKTFIAVAREGTITRAAERVHLSQPAVSAHIKAIEDALELTLFDRTARGMTLTADGERLLVKAERALAAHDDLFDEAARLKGDLSGRLRVGVGGNADHVAVGQLVTRLAERHPGIELSLAHAGSADIVARLLKGTLDAAFYNDGGAPDPTLSTIETARFTTYLAAAPGLTRLDWPTLATLTWIYPPASACCGKTAEALFTTHGIRPRRVLTVDGEPLARTLIASGAGVGLLHEGTALDAAAKGEVELLHAIAPPVRSLFAYATARASEPLLAAAITTLQSSVRRTASTASAATKSPKP